MVRAKKVTDVGKQAEALAMLDKLKLKFKNDKRDLEGAKRSFSTNYVLEVLKGVEESVPQNVLDMKAKDFAVLIKKFGLTEDFGLNNNFNDLQTPLHARRKFKSITTPSGVPLQIPSLITPRVNGAILRSRTSRQGEVLFSINGTPVTVDDEIPSVSSADARDQAKIVQDLLQQNESEMSPATLKIMKQLKVVLNKAQ